jgi:diguanylate cyclase (GGDEF)-like protein/PAS domain S-box-containing protein
MYSVLNCLVFEHDWRLIALAAALCFLSSYTAMSMSRRAAATSDRAKFIWLISGGFAGGFGIWATHFVAMLAYDPGVVFGYDTTATLTSLAIAIASTCTAIAASLFIAGNAGAMAAGILFGIGVSSMHFVGMTAIEFPGSLIWDRPIMIAAIALAVMISLPAFFVAKSAKQGATTILISSGTLSLAIVSMHFTAMGAITVVPSMTVLDPANLLSPLFMVITIATVAISMLFAGLTVAIFAVRSEAAAAAGEKNFRLLVQGVTDYAIYMLDPSGRVTNWNAGAERAKGYQAAEIIGKNFSCFYTAEDIAADLPNKNLEIALTDGRFEAEGWRVRKDGSRLWAHVVIDVIHDDDGAFVGFAKITRDCTEQKHNAEILTRTSGNLDLALAHMANGLCLFDEEDRLILCNDRLYDILGIEPAKDLTGKTLEDLCLFNPADATNRYRQYRALIESGGGEVTTLLPSGKYIRTTYTPTHTGAYVMTAEDVTSRIHSEEQITHLARHDPLTGLPNRRQFMEVLEGAIERADVLNTNVAVVGIDLNRFKDINDTHGHATGDEVLCVLAQRMGGELLDGESVGRFGGDEFVAQKSYSSELDLLEFIARLRKALTEDIQLAHVDVTPGASLGVAIYPNDADNREKLLNNADLAMYRAKDSNEETVCFYEASMDEAERARRALAKDIWTAIEQDQFFLHYQVQTAAVTGELTGYEVLLRWQHPVHGMIPPDRFIAIAEDCGAITALGEWVLEKACRDAASRPLEKKIAVNLSPLQLTNVHLVDKVREILVLTGLAPERLELEVTESAIIGDKTRALHILRQIKAMGVGIAIDDFGTGYSSLETLRAFPFDKIKLDRSFVSDLATDRQAKAFIRAILALGKSLEVPVLAEGVETEEQMAVLTEEGCNEFQGYYFGRPTTLDLLAHTIPTRNAVMLAS